MFVSGQLWWGQSWWSSWLVFVRGQSFVELGRGLSEPSLRKMKL